MHFTQLTSEAEIRDLIDYYNKERDYIVLDIETTGLDYFTDTITDIVLSGKEPDSSVIFSSEFLPLLKSLRIPVVAHNFRFDFNMLYRAGVDLRISGLFADTMLLDHLLDENNEHSLDSIVKRRYNDNYKEVFWTTYKAFEDAPKEAQVEYACKDVIYTARIYRDISEDLAKSGIPSSMIEHVHKVANKLYDTELTGLKLDLPYLSAMAEELTHKIQACKIEMREMVDLHCTVLENADYLEELDKRKTDKGKAGVKRPVFNFDSSKQLGILLYDKLKLPIQLNKQRNRTVDDGALEKLEHRHPVVKRLREYRGYQKVYTAFIEGSLEKLQNGRIHPSFNVNGTVTGRISSSNPNMQQLPKQGGVRGIYIPDPGYSFISCDYKQLEVTLAAHFSRDKNLLKIVYEGASQHDITASGLGVDRAIAKTINFALQYGAGVKKIQYILGCGENEAQQALDKYWQTYEGLREFVKQCHMSIDQGKPLVNPFGRRRRFPVKFDTFWDKERAKRQAANSLIQGTGADITNMALYLVDNELSTKGIGKALFPIHDEILISCKNNSCQEASDILTYIMKDIGVKINLTVPLDVDCSKPMQRWEKA